MVPDIRSEEGPDPDPPEPPASIVVAHRDTVVREGVARILERENGLRATAFADTLQDLREVLGSARPDLLILGLELRVGDGLEFLRTLGGDEEEPPVLVLSIYDELVFADRCLRLGARGYVQEDVPAPTLVDAVRAILRGEIHVSERVRQRILTTMVQNDESRPPRPIDELTDRELQVFRLLGEGQRTRDIAEMLHLSVKTIETYRANIMKKLQLEHATELLQKAVAWVWSQERG